MFKRPFVITLLFAFQIVFCFAQEGIFKYHTDIEVNKDGSVLITEKIMINAAGKGYDFQRGILRDIPNVMEDSEGYRFKIDIDIIEILKDGEPENYYEEEINNGIQLRIGNADVFLEPGKYEYTIKYKVGEQVRFFENYDEVYWNAIGDQWGYTIQQASARIILPGETKILQQAAYSGGYGETGCECEVSVQNDSIVNFKMNQPLDPYSAFTVAVGFEKGHIEGPTPEEIEKRKLERMKPLFYAGGGLILVLLYYFLAWLKVGVDPKTGPIVPRWDPPNNYSPAAVRFVNNMNFDKKAFTASIINMAVKKFLIIDKTGTDYKLIKNSENESLLSKGERKVANEIFKGRSTFTIKQSNYKTLRKAISNLGSQLEIEFEKINFKLNSLWLIPGIIITVVTVFLLMGSLFEQIEMFMGLMFIMVFSVFLITAVIGWIKQFRNSSGFALAFVILKGVITAGVLLAILTNISYLIADSHLVNIHFIGYVLYFIILFGMNGLFFYLIKAPTVQGRKIMDEIEGLKMYMETAEKHRLNMLNPPEKTPELFEKLLPFAIALGVDQKWSEQFDDVLAKAMENNEYQPGWYRGTSYHNISHLSRDLSSDFNSSISSSSISPQSSSSSGSSGGGFSGGGGGGGGGGGW